MINQNPTKRIQQKGDILIEVSQGTFLRGLTTAIRLLDKANR